MSKVFLEVGMICFQRTRNNYKGLKYADIYQVTSSFGEGKFSWESWNKNIDIGIFYRQAV
jgi:hypothetical protein